MAKNINNNEKILDVKDLRISFKTDNGTVKAVRGISFSLYKGKTFAIVGESGSGKSVTSRAILGILANNKIIEGGQILYDGKDLLTLSEDRFTRIRGSKISMIFQDPLSSLNPIMKVGKQLTEPMFLKAKFAKREAKHIVLSLDKSFATISAKNPQFNADIVNRFLADEEKRFEVFNRNNLLQIAYDKSVVEARKHNDKEEKLAAVAKAKKAEFTPNMIVVAPFDENNNEKFVSEFEVGSENYQELTKALISYIDFDKSKSNVGLAKLAELLESILSTNASNFANFKSVELKAKIKEIKALISESHFSFETDRDDIIEVLPVSLENYLADFAEAIKYQTKLERIAAKEKESGKHKVKSARQRALARESVATPNQVFDIIKATLVMCDEHIDQILHVEKFDSSIYVKEFIEFYKNAIFTKYNKVRKAEAKTRAIKLLGEVGIPEPARRYNQYPFEFSGGMRQRIVIAIALSSNPEILICDEPTTALDVTIQAQILELINKIKVEKNLSIIFITHDLGVVANMADDIAVMYAGKIVEYGSVEEIFYDPRHPYTWALLGSMPDLDTKQQLSAIPGTPPNMILPPKGDAFAIRNKYAMEIDFEEEPPLFKVSDTHFAATWLLHPSAPKVEMPAVVKERIERTKGDFKNGK